MVEDIEAVIEIEATRERVWAALTDKAQVESWMGCLRYEGLAGTMFYLQLNKAKRRRGDVTGAIQCRIEHLEAPRRFAFSWAFPDTADTQVAFELRRIPGGTHVKLVHSGWDQFEPEDTEEVRANLLRAWHAYALPALKAAVEG